MSLNNKSRKNKDKRELEERKMYCQKCGSEVEQGQKACPKCGEPVRRGMQISTMQMNSRKNIVMVIMIAVAVLVIFAVVKMVGKSDEERIAGTWTLVEERYNGKPIEYDIGAQITFKKGGRFYDEEEFLRSHINAGGTIISWDILEDNHILLFINEYHEQCSAKYEFSGKLLKIISGENAYCILEKQ